MTVNVYGRHFSTYARVTFRKVRRMSDLVQFTTEYIQSIV